MKRYLLLAVFFACGLVVSESIATQRLGVFGRLRSRRDIRVQAPGVRVLVGQNRFRGNQFRFFPQRGRVQQFDIRIPVQVETFDTGGFGAGGFGYGGGFGAGGQCSGFFR